MDMSLSPIVPGSERQPPEGVAAARGDIGRGLRAGQFCLEYQPKFNVREKRVVGLEALMRWDHPERGRLSPDHFITRAEHTGSIADLTIWAVEQALIDQIALEASGCKLGIFINLSAQLLTDEPVLRALCTLAQHPGADLGIEVTERSVIADPELAFANIRRLREAGYRIAIDDYGTGLSSLTYLKQIEADELKIDKSFITLLGSSNRDPLIVRSTIDLAHALGMVVTAEGVETQAAYALLTVMGCDVMQGFLIGRPMRADTIVEYLARFDPQSIAVPFDPRALRDQRIWKSA
jgi:EAL domain-containing protein (putative c-di-GMP-specific phosphodiesterase class I)